MTKLIGIAALSLAKLQAVVMAIVGLAVGVLYAVGGAAYDVVTTGTFSVGTALAFLAVPGMPLVFAVAGFVTGVCVAPAFNAIAVRLGGLALDIRQR